MSTIYTLGYAAWTLDAIVNTVVKLDAVLIDTRLVPASRNHQFNRKSIAQEFAHLESNGRAHYQWVKGFGNVNYKDGRKPVVLFNFEVGMQEIQMHVQRRRAIVLMCMCREAVRCHRSVVADMLAKRIRARERIVHLTPGDLAAIAQGCLH